MDFNKVEGKVRELISRNKIEEAIEFLNSSFKDDPDVDDIVLQSAKYYSIRRKEIEGGTNDLELELELSRLRSNILKILQSKKEYYKYKNQTFGSDSISETSGHGLIKVFLSVASPFNDDQLSYINRLTLYFKENGILLDTLSKWDDNDPLVPIMSQMKKSSGCLVLALERYYVDSGLEKRGSDQESKISNRSYTSPWLHIEAALARSYNLPLLILKDISLVNEGLIHNDKQEWGIVRIDQSNVNEIHEYPIKHFVLNWINQVKRFADNNDRN